MKVVLDTNVYISAIIIGGDKKHILSLKQFRKIKIISPKDFLEMLLS